MDWRSGEIRTREINEWLLNEVLEELHTLDHPRVRKLVKYLERQRDEMLTFLDLLEVCLAPWQRQLAQYLPDGTERKFFQATVARAWRLNRAVANGHISFRSEAEFATASMAELVADDPVAFELAEVLPIACELFDLYWEMSLEMGERIGTWGDDALACYIAAVADCCPNYYGDVIRVMCPEGVVRVRFPARDFRAHLTYQETDYSYAGQTSYKGEVMRANSLARINMARCMGTPRADEYLARFKEAFGQPAHAIMLFDLARGIELVYALERAMEILAEPLDHENSNMPYTPRDGEGHGLGEAPYKLPGREGRPDALSRTGKATARRQPPDDKISE